MADNIGDLQVAIGADIAAFEVGMAKVQDDLARVAAAAEASAGRYTDAQGRTRAANGQFVSSAQLAAEAAANVGGSLGKLSDDATQLASTVNGKLVSSFQAFDAAAKPLNEGVGRLGEGLKSAGQGLSLYVTAPLALLGGAAISTASELQALQTGFAATYKGAEPLADALKRVTDLAKLPGLGLKEALEGATNLQAAGFSADTAARALGAFGNALGTVGKGKAELDRVTLALTQINNTPFVQGQDLNQLRQTLPQIGEAMKQAFGATSAEQLRSLGITSQQFISGIIAQFEKLPPVGNTLKNSLENLSDAGTKALAGLGSALDKNFDLQGLVNTISTGIGKAVDAFNALTPATQKTIFVLAGLAAAAGPVALGLGTVLAVIPSLVGGLEVLGLATTTAAVAASEGIEAIAASTTLALGPIGLIAAGVAVAVALIIENWDSIVAYFGPSGEGGQIMGDLADSVGAAIDNIVKAFDQLKGLGKGSFGDLVTASGVAKGAFQGLATGIKDVADVVGGSIGFITKLFKEDFVGAEKDAENALYGLLDPLATVFGFIKKEKPAELFGDFAPAAKTAADAVDYFGDEVVKTGKKVQTLKELQAELKAALEQRFTDAQAGNDTTADDANIARIRALIAEYKQLPGHVDAATKALQKLRAELAALNALDGLLAVPADGFDETNRRAKALESGLKSLLEAGFRPGSAAVQQYATELLTLQQSLAKVQAASTLDFKVSAIKLPPITFGQANPDQVLGGISQELADHPLLVPFKLTPLKSDFSTEIANIGLDLSAALSKIGVESAAFGRGFDLLGERTDAFRQQLQSLIDKGISPLDPAFKKAIQDLKDAEAQERRTKEITEGLQHGFETLGSDIGSSLSNGQGILKGVLAGIIDALADFAEKKGKLLIAAGIADFALGNVVQGGLEVAAGVGLIAAAGVGHSYASSLTSGSGGGGVSSPSGTSTSAAGSSGSSISIPKEVKIVLRGQDAVGILRLQDYRVSRTN